MTNAKQHPRLQHGETVIHERVTMIDGMRKFVTREAATALYRDGLARPERLYLPLSMASTDCPSPARSVRPRAVDIHRPDAPRHNARQTRDLIWCLLCAYQVRADRKAAPLRSI